MTKGTALTRCGVIQRGVIQRSPAKGLLAAAAAGLAALLAAGCSAGTAQHAATPAKPGASPQQAVELAAYHAKTATSVTATVSMQMTGAVTMTMSGTLAEQIRPRLLAEMRIPVLKAAGQTLPGGMTEILAGQAFYMHAPDLPLPGGKPWVKIPFSDLTGTSGVNLGQLLQQAQNENPMMQAQMLASAKGVHEAGKTTVGGVPVTEYTGHYSMADALASIPASERSAADQQMTKAGVGSVDFTVWLDDQQMVRKLVLTVPSSAFTMTMTMLVTGINQPVTVQLPAASQTTVAPASALKSGS